ncbi:hypothetical protein CBS101457_003629 [Exobasidium rhododendri]|nr:hypothetical protein CBS101457_003629 [Exobasidium rhododendri]
MSADPSSIEVAPGLLRLIHDVEAFQIPHLLAPHTGIDELETIERDLLLTLKKIEAELENFLLDCADAGNSARERSAWSDAIQNAQSQVARVKKESQEALVRSRKQWKAQARNALWSDMAQSKEEREKRKAASTADQSSEDKLMTASGDVTSALQRAVTSMSIELEKSSYSSQLLDESSMTIQRASLEYTSFTDLVSSSRKLIKSMERADFIDAIKLCLSFAFFLLCIAYIIKRRIWDKGIGILSFLFRLGGLSTSRSVEDVKEKLKLAKEAAKQLESSKVAEIARTTIMSTIASAAASSSTILSASQAVPSPDIVDFAEEHPASVSSTILSASQASQAVPSPSMIAFGEEDSSLGSTSSTLAAITIQEPFHHDEL